MSTEVASDLVANVAKVLVAVGDTVLAEVDGSVVDVRVREGDVVQDGDVLVVLD